MSNYSLEQLMKNGNYSKICDMFFSLGKDSDTLKQLKSILYDGCYNDYELVSGMSNKNNPNIEMQRRIGLAYLLITNKNTLDILASKNINLFHGTNANALPSILEYGMLCTDDSINKGINVTTGETSTRLQGRSFISFTDVLDVAAGYSTIKPTEDNNLFSFGVIIGISKQTATKSSPIKIHSEIPEVGINKNIPPEDIDIIMVPSDKVKTVQKMTNQNISVLAIDNIEDKFYYIDEFGYIDIYLEKYEQLKQNLTHKKKSSILTGVKDTVLSRTTSSIQSILDKIKNKSQGENYEHRSIKS